MKKLTYKDVVNNEEYVSLVNRVYHDIESRSYDSNHPEILDLEVTGWRLIVKQVFDAIGHKENRVILDIGTGTGFVVDVMQDLLSNNDTVVFSDISSEMLAICRERFKSAPFKKTFIEGNCTNINLPSVSVDVITVNSVLHHIPNVEKFFVECNRLLKHGGYLVIKHEPNVRFAKSPLSYLYRFLLYLRRLKLNASRKTIEAKPIYFQTLKELREKEALDITGITERELHAIVDIHSPTARGSLDPKRGFDPYKFQDWYLKNFTTVGVKTYGFLGKINERGSLFRRCVTQVLKTSLPKNGYFFDIILKKHDK